jgi:hypothetical protein
LRDRALRRKSANGPAVLSNMAGVTLDLVDPERLRRELRSFLGVGLPGPAPSVEVLSSSHEDGYVLHRVHVVTEDDAIPSLLAVPSGTGPFPAVTIVHQHAGQRHFGKSEVSASAATRTRRSDQRLPGLGSSCSPPTQSHSRTVAPWAGNRPPRRRLGPALQRSHLPARRRGHARAQGPRGRHGRRLCLVGPAGREAGGGRRLGALLRRNTTLFLAGVDERIRTGCASGALASYRRMISDGTGIEMAEVIPGFTTRFDMHHVLVAIALRHFLVVSAPTTSTQPTPRKSLTPHSQRSTYPAASEPSHTFESLADTPSTPSASRPSPTESFSRRRARRSPSGRG